MLPFIIISVILYLIIGIIVAVPFANHCMAHGGDGIEIMVFTIWPILIIILGFIHVFSYRK